MGNRGKLLSFDYAKHIPTLLHVAALREILANVAVDVFIVCRTIATFPSTSHVFFALSTKLYSGTETEP